MKTLRLIAFPGAPNLPIFAANAEGFFTAQGIVVELTTTPSSTFQFEQLYKGGFDLAGTAFDNVVAYAHGHGAVPLDGPLDVFAFLGASQIELSLVAHPDIASMHDLRGKTIAMDALATGFAFVVHHLLGAAGLAREEFELVAVGATPARWESVEAGIHAATLTIEPFTAMARASGFTVLGTSTQAFDAYQGGVFATRRCFAEANEDALRGYITGYLNALAWVTEDANRARCAELLLTHMPALKAGAMAPVLDKVLTPKTGLTPDGDISPAGVATVLGLRSKYHDSGLQLTDASRYIDLSLRNSCPSIDAAGGGVMMAPGPPS